MRVGYKLCILGLCAALPLAMAPTGGYPSRPTFQQQTVGLSGSDNVTRYFASGAAVDAKNTLVRTNTAGNFAVSRATDAAPFTAVDNAFVATRTGGAFTTIAIGNVADAPTITLNGATPCTATNCPTLASANNFSNANNFNSGGGPIELAIGTGTVDMLGTITANSAAVAGAIGASATSGASTVVPTGLSLASVALSTEQFDTGSYHDLVTNNSRVILPSGSGYADCTGTISYSTGLSAALTNHRIFLWLRKNGTDYLAVASDLVYETSAGTTLTGALSVSNAMMPANGTDYVELVTAQDGFTTTGLVVANNLTSTAATTRLTCSAS